MHKNSKTVCHKVRALNTVKRFLGFKIIYPFSHMAFNLKPLFYHRHLARNKLKDISVLLYRIFSSDASPFVHSRQKNPDREVVYLELLF